MANDLYATLGVARNASQEDIKSAYRKLSKEWHPDKHKGDKKAEERFKEINQAYEVLSNPEKRSRYDQFGSMGGPGGSGGGAGFSGFDGFDVSGFQNGGAADLGDLFETFFGGGSRQKQDRGVGADKEVAMEVTLADAVSGIQVPVTIDREMPCDRCGGNGAEPGSSLNTCATCSGTGQVTRSARSFFGSIQQRMVCSTCRGSGKVPEKSCTRCSGEGRLSQRVSITVQVPPGIDDGQTLRVPGEGDAGRQGAQSGDLYVHVRVRRDARFERDGADIRTTLTISVLQAILGEEIEIDTVRGRVTLAIPAGTQPGQVLRLKGKGLPVLGSSRTGDHYVTIQIEIPHKLSRAERKIVEEWKNVRGE